MSHAKDKIAAMTLSEKTEMAESYISFLRTTGSVHSRFVDLVLMVRELNQDICSDADCGYSMDTAADITADIFKVIGDDQYRWNQEDSSSTYFMSPDKMLRTLQLPKVETHALVDAVRKDSNPWKDRNIRTLGLLESGTGRLSHAGQLRIDGVCWRFPDLCRMTIVDEIHGYGWDISLSEESFVTVMGSEDMLKELRLKNKPSHPNYLEMAFDGLSDSIAKFINSDIIGYQESSTVNIPKPADWS